MESTVKTETNDNEPCKAGPSSPLTDQEDFSLLYADVKTVSEDIVKQVVKAAERSLDLEIMKVSDSKTDTQPNFRD
ncbi:hypothetical protein ILUMI_09756 [Ignelater luminosus]|uniref:Uncharacterized protein n=1 Tax=Ignelater luminosus TaxID=2038154 RepID=A0A8K0D4H4_IGNLU|nr:hypothetical protein ILUMI_09756 [Ignelater luminosus]